MGSPSVHVTDLLLLLCAAGLSLGGLTQEQKKQFLDAHNARRQNVHHMPDATGETLEGLGLRVLNMKKMKWDYVLAESAQDMADRCLPDHAFPKVAAYNRTVLQFRTVAMGQNLAMLNRAEETELAEQAVWAWVEREAAWYHWHNMSCYNDQAAAAPTQYCGHLTAALWDSSEYLGCGYSVCNRSMTDGTYENFVCHYMPGGNFMGELPFETTAAAASSEPTCSDPSTTVDCEYDNLCADVSCQEAQRPCADEPGFANTCLGMLGVLPSAYTCEARSDGAVATAMKYCPRTCGYCRDEIYRLLDGAQELEDARASCEALGMQLVTPESLHQMEEVVESFHRQAEQFGIPARRGFWLGYAKDAASGSFVSLYDPTRPMPAELWRAGQPSGGWDCVARKRVTSDLSMRGAEDLPCTYKHLPMCQMERSTAGTLPEEECDDTVWKWYCAAREGCFATCDWLAFALQSSSGEPLEAGVSEMDAMCAGPYAGYCLASCGVCQQISESKAAYRWRIEQEFGVFEYGPFVSSGDGGVTPGQLNCSCLQASA